MIGCRVQFIAPNRDGMWEGLCFDVRHGEASVACLGHPFVYRGPLAAFTITGTHYTAPTLTPTFEVQPTPAVAHDAITAPIHRIAK